MQKHGDGQSNSWAVHPLVLSTFREYLNSQPLNVGYADHSDSYTDLDFSLRIGAGIFTLELKEKKQKYNLLNWEGVHISEEHLMLIDELSIRKIVLSGASAGLLVKDSMRDKLFFFSMIDLVLMPKIKRFNRLAREIFPVDFFGIHAERRVAQFIAGETVETGVVGIQLGAEVGAKS